MEFLELRPEKRPFCLSVSFKAPHAQDGDSRQFIFDQADQALFADAHIAPPPGFDPSAFQRFPEFFRRNNEGRARWELRFSTPERFQQMVKGYYRLIAGVDRAIGRILN